MASTNRNPAACQADRVAASAFFGEKNSPLSTSDSNRSQASIVIIVTPAAPGMFEARLAGRNSALLTSRQPFLDSARALLAAGVDPTTLLVMQHGGIVSLTGEIGVAAKLTVGDDRFGTPRFRRWTASESDVAAPPIARNESAATSGRGAA